MSEGTEQPLKLGDRIALRPKEVAKALGISDRTLRKWMRDEGLPSFRVGDSVFIPSADLQHWMQERISSEQVAEEIAGEILRGF